MCRVKGRLLTKTMVITCQGHCSFMAALGEDSEKDGGCGWAKEESVRWGSWGLTPDLLSLWLKNLSPCLPSRTRVGVFPAPTTGT